MAELEFEKPVVELRNKIRELKDYTKNSQMDFSEEIRILEEKLENLEEDIYGNLKVWGVFKLLVMQNDRQRSIILSTYLLIF